MENFHMVDTEETTIQEIFGILDAAKYRVKKCLKVDKGGGLVYSHAEIEFPAIILHSNVAKLEALLHNMGARIVGNTNSETVYIYPTK